MKVTVITGVRDFGVPTIPASTISTMHRSRSPPTRRRRRGPPTRIVTRPVTRRSGRPTGPTTLDGLASFGGRPATIVTAAIVAVPGPGRGSRRHVKEPPWEVVS